MQTTFYYKDRDKYLIDKVEEKASRERKSKSAVILSVLEEYFESKQRIGEILKDLGALESKELEKALNSQMSTKDDKKLGQIMLDEDFVREVDLNRALTIQDGDK